MLQKLETNDLGGRQLMRSEACRLHSGVQPGVVRMFTQYGIRPLPE